MCGTCGCLVMTPLHEHHVQCTIFSPLDFLTVSFSAPCLFWTAQFCSLKFNPAMVILYFSRSVRVIRDSPTGLAPDYGKARTFSDLFPHSAAGAVSFCLPFHSYGWFYRVGSLAPFKTLFFSQCWDWQNIFIHDIRHEVY